MLTEYRATVRSRSFFSALGGYVILPERSYTRFYSEGYSPSFPVSDTLVLQDYRRDLGAFAQFVPGLWTGLTKIEWEVVL